MTNVYTFDNSYSQNQSYNICSLNINEIDLSEYISGTNEEKKEIASLFEKSFHEYDVIRLTNHNIASELVYSAKELFWQNLKTKLEFYNNSIIV